MQQGKRAIGAANARSYCGRISCAPARHVLSQTLPLKRAIRSGQFMPDRRAPIAEPVFALTE
jgi:hypothetical protein